MENNYNEALKDSPDWVKEAYDEFRKLPQWKQGNTPFLYYLLGTGKGTQPFKMPKHTANYQSLSPTASERCGNCIFFFVQPKGGRNICSKIRGQVKPEGWCKLWD